MKNLGYKKEMINKEVEIILSQGMEKKISQDILTAREMIISGASDEEIRMKSMSGIKSISQHFRKMHI